MTKDRPDPILSGYLHAPPLQLRSCAGLITAWVAPRTGASSPCKGAQRGFGDRCYQCLIACAMGKIADRPAGTFRAWVARTSRPWGLDHNRARRPGGNPTLNLRDLWSGILTT